MGKSAYEILKAKKFDALIAVLVDHFGSDETAAIWVDAERRLEEFLATTKDLPDLEQLHAEGFIYPVCALYLAIADHCDRDEAFGLCEDFMRENALNSNKKLQKALKIPATRRAFMKGFGFIGERLFGEEAGFEQRMHEASSTRLRMDILSCPYARHCAKAGAPELAQLFCANDDYAYGNLPGIRFARTGTIARGAELCDFELTLEP